MIVWDALGHEQQMKKSCTNFANQLQDTELKNFVQELCNKHQQSFNRFYGLLNNN